MSEDFFTKLDEFIKPEIMLRIVGSPGANIEIRAALTRVVNVINSGKQRELVLVLASQLL